MHKVLWITNIPSPYKVNFFNLLGVKTKLTVLFERNNSSERNEKWINRDFTHFKGIFLRGLKYKADTLISFDIFKYINQHYDFIFLSNPMTPSGITASMYMKLLSIPFVIEGDGAFKPVRESKIRFFIKRLALKKAKFYFSTGEDHTSYYNHYGVNFSKIIRYSFSSVNNDEIISKPISFNEKNNLKKRKNLKPIFTITYIGQFIHRKGIDILLKSAVLLKYDYQLILIGGSKEEAIKFGSFDEKRMQTIEFLTKNEIFDYLDLSDVFVLPTREDIWGLVINEAIARGIPVISTNASGAANNLILNGRSGFIINPNDDIALTEKIEVLQEDSELRYQMGEKAIKVAQKFTIEKMVDDHTNFIKKESRLD